MLDVKSQNQVERTPLGHVGLRTGAQLLQMSFEDAEAEIDAMLDPRERFARLVLLDESINPDLLVPAAATPEDDAGDEEPDGLTPGGGLPDVPGSHLGEVNKMVNAAARVHPRRCWCDLCMPERFEEAV